VEEYPDEQWLACNGVLQNRAGSLAPRHGWDSAAVGP
jgi:hypothetical protein